MFEKAKNNIASRKKILSRGCVLFILVMWSSGLLVFVPMYPG